MCKPGHLVAGPDSSALLQGPALQGKYLSKALGGHKVEHKETKSRTSSGSSPKPRVSVDGLLSLKPLCTGRCVKALGTNTGAKGFKPLTTIEARPTSSGTIVSRYFYNLLFWFMIIPRALTCPARTRTWMPEAGSAGRLAGAGSSWYGDGNVFDRDKHKGVKFGKRKGRN